MLGIIRRNNQSKTQMAALRKIGIIVKENAMIPVLYNQLIGHYDAKKVKEAIGKVKAMFNALKISLPLTITRLSNVQKPSEYCDLYETESNLILRVRSTIVVTDRFEIGKSSDGKKFESMSLELCPTIIRSLSDAQQYETLKKTSYQWTYVLEGKKVSVAITGYMKSTLADYGEFSENLIKAKGNFGKIVCIVKKFTKCNMNARVLLEAKGSEPYQEYENRQLVKIVSGKIVENRITEENYCFCWMAEDEEWEITKDIEHQREKHDLSIPKVKYNVKLRYTKKSYLLDVTANINRDDFTKSDEFGVIQLISIVERKVKEHLAGNNPETTVFNIKTESYNLDFLRSNKWRYDTNSLSADSKNRLRVNITYTNTNKWKVCMAKSLNKDEVQQLIGVRNLLIQAEQLIKSMK